MIFELEDELVSIWLRFWQFIYFVQVEADRVLEVLSIMARFVHNVDRCACKGTSIYLTQVRSLDPYLDVFLFEVAVDCLADFIPYYSDGVDVNLGDVLDEVAEDDVLV